MKKQKPRFFCDNCGFEVDSEVKACPHCGRFFASVRCPICDYSGPDRIFQNGCPLCGYSASPVPKELKQPKPRVKKVYAPSEPLPFWAIFAAFAAFLIALALFLFFISK